MSRRRRTLLPEPGAPHRNPRFLTAWDSAGAPVDVDRHHGRVIVTFIALAMKPPIVWVSYTPLPPLFLLLFTGLYLFVLPYAAKRRGGRTD